MPDIINTTKGIVLKLLMLLGLIMLLMGTTWVMYTSSLVLYNSCEDQGDTFVCTFNKAVRPAFQGTIER